MLFSRCFFSRANKRNCDRDKNAIVEVVLRKDDVMETHSTIKKRQDDRYVRTSEQDPQEYERAQRPQPTTPEGAEEEVEVPRKEKALIEVHPAMFGNHPATYLFYWALVVGGIIGAAMFWMAGAVFSGVLCLIAAAWGGAFLAAWWIRLQFRVLRITEKRTLFRKGIFSKATNEVQHDDVRNIQMDQTFFQRLVGVGDLAISSSGQDDMEIDVRGISRPEEVVQLIRRYQ